MLLSQLNIFATISSIDSKLLRLSGEVFLYKTSAIAWRYILIFCCSSESIYTWVMVIYLLSIMPSTWQAIILVFILIAKLGCSPSIVPMIEAIGASVICLSPYSPDFNPIELWWSQLKSFLRKFAPTNAFMIDRIIAVAVNLISPQHLKNWFASCCYCTS